MKFKLDENLPADLVDLLRSSGHDAVTVGMQGLGGTDDTAVAVACGQEGRALITLDTDFADIKTYPPGDYTGLVVLRLARQNKRLVTDVIRRIIPLFAREPLSGRLWIVEEQQVRIHGEQ